MSDVEDFIEDAEKPNLTSDLMTKLNEQCERIDKADAFIEAIEEKLKKAKELRLAIIRETIPNIMDEMNLDNFKLKDGRKVEVKDKVAASISKANEEEAFKWLEENKHGDLIKCDVTIKFNREEKEKVEELVQKLIDENYTVTNKNAVHPQTLASFVREQLEKGEDFPKDLLGVFTFREAKITNKK